MLLKLLVFLLPWTLKWRALNKFWGYHIHSEARIGFAWIFPKKLIMESGSKIDHFSVAIHLDKIHLKQNAQIGRSNWITGLSVTSNSSHFKHQNDRRAELIVGESSSITKNHHIDCTNSILIGKFSTIAGYQSQLLTHSINVVENIQDSRPITIGDYTFVGTNVVILGGSALPAFSVLGAKSLLNKYYYEEWKVYGGVPAKPVSDISRDAKYFCRTDGFVH